MLSQTLFCQSSGMGRDDAAPGYQPHAFTVSALSFRQCITGPTDRIGAAVHISPDLRTQKAQGRGGSRHQKFDLAIPAISNLLGMLLACHHAMTAGRGWRERQADQHMYGTFGRYCTVVSQDLATIPSVSNKTIQNGNMMKYDEVASSYTQLEAKATTMRMSQGVLASKAMQYIWRNIAVASRTFSFASLFKHGSQMFPVCR